MSRPTPNIVPHALAWFLCKAFAAGARWPTGLWRTASSAHARGVRAAVLAGALKPLALVLAASSTPEHRALAPMLADAVEAADRVGALALVRTAGRRTDVRTAKILSHRYRFLWICNPKVASRSLIAALRAADPAAVLIRGHSLDRLHARHPEARSFFNFAFLRHPVERTRSFYADKHALARRDRNAYRHFIEPYHGLRLGMSFEEVCRWLATPCGADAFADRHWLSQSRQIATADGRLPDFIGRYERLETDWRTVCERLRLPSTALPRLNASDRRLRRQAVVNDETAALLRRRYAADFKLGGYGDAP